MRADALEELLVVLIDRRHEFPHPHSGNQLVHQHFISAVGESTRAVQ